jgi:hypothetical protein
VRGRDGGAGVSGWEGDVVSIGGGVVVMISCGWGSVGWVRVNGSEVAERRRDRRGSGGLSNWAQKRQ